MNRHRPCKMRRLAIFACAAASVFAAAARNANGQLRVEAYSGQPFGVAAVTVGGLLAPADLPLGDLGIEVVEASGRAYYPAVQSGPARQFLRKLLDRRQAVTVLFLFPGGAPLDITLFAGRPYQAQVVPRPDPRRHRRLLEQWWREYGLNLDSLSKRGGFPPLVQNYLGTTLARRLRLPPRKSSGFNEQSDADQLLGLLLGTDAIRVALQQDRLLGDSTGGIADVPMPPAIAPPAVVYAKPTDEPEIEDIARHVPDDCFYMRFGNYANFQWLRDWLNLWGGDLRNLVTQQGVNYAVNGRVERQLALKDDQLSRLFAGTVISDVALIGHDTFLREGAAIGVLFEARSSFLLSQGIGQNRANVLSETEGAVEEKLTIAGREVSFLSTANNRLRSFYAVDGDYHLITNCRRLAERFLEAGGGKGALADAADFRHARDVIPVARDDTIFIHLSDGFFRNLSGPHYRVEMTRRLASVMDMETIDLARLAASHEGFQAATVPELISAGFLPASFGRRADGSKLVQENGQWIDSSRGARGVFLPIPDVEISAVTRQEAASYTRFASEYASEWSGMDPIFIGIRRDVVGEDGLEQISLDVNASPIPRQRYAMLQQFLGAPTTDRIRPLPNDLVFAEVMMAGRFVAGRPYRLFTGLRSYDPVIEYHYGRLRYPNLRLNSLQAYLGTTPHPGIFQAFGGAEYVPPAGESGPVQTPVGDGWQQTQGDISVFSPQQDLVEEVVPALEYEPIERPAQIRLHVKNLTGTELEPLINRMGYGRTLQVSQANSELLQALSAQLGVPRENSLEIAEELLDVELTCPLGGEYRLVDRQGGLPRWQSTAVREDLTSAFSIADPIRYQFPLLTWFRGLDLDFSMDSDALHAHADLLMQIPTKDQGEAGE